MNVFIDTNLLLDFFRMSSGDLDEIRKIALLSKSGELNLLISDFVQDEFFRNRETVISTALKQFEKSKAELHRPNIEFAFTQNQSNWNRFKLGSENCCAYWGNVCKPNPVHVKRRRTW